MGNSKIKLSKLEQAKDNKDDNKVISIRFSMKHVNMLGDFAKQYGMTLSSAVKFLALKALAIENENFHKTTENTQEEKQNLSAIQIPRRSR